MISIAIGRLGVNIYQKKVSWVRGWANLITRGQRLLALFGLTCVWYQMEGNLISSMNSDIHLLNKYFYKKVMHGRRLFPAIKSFLLSEEH